MRSLEPFHIDPRALPRSLRDKTPCNDVISPTVAIIASIAASAAGAAISYSSSQNAAKQAEYNAQAQNEALAMEQKRKAAEFAENQRRAAVEHKRQRAAAAAALASQGIMTTTGSPLAELADTWQTQQVQLGDEQYLQDLEQRRLQYERKSALTMGANNAAGYRAQGVGTALSNLASIGGQAYRAFGTRTTTP